MRFSFFTTLYDKTIKTMSIKATFTNCFFVDSFKELLSFVSKEDKKCNFKRMIAEIRKILSTSYLKMQKKCIDAQTPVLE